MIRYVLNVDVESPDAVRRIHALWQQAMRSARTNTVILPPSVRVQELKPSVPTAAFLSRARARAR